MTGTPGELVPLTFTFSTEDESLCAFARRYWEARFGPGKTLKYAITVRDLTAEFGWKSSDAITLANDVALVSFGHCSTCNKPMVVRSRSDLDRATRIGDRQTCHPCMDELYRQRTEQYQEQLRQQQLREEQRQREIAAMKPEQKRQLHLDSIYKALPPMNPDDFTVIDAIYLLAAFRASQSEYLNYLMPLAKTLEAAQQNHITPGSLYSYELLNHLIRRKLIRPAPQSNHSAFDWTADNEVENYYVYHVIWRIAPSNRQNEALVETIDQIFRNWKHEIPAFCMPQINTLWQDIALHECIEFLQHEMKKHHLAFKRGEMTDRVVKDGLTTYSVGQMYNHIYGATQAAAAYSVEKAGEITIFQAANSVVRRIENRIERARVNDYDIKNYRRNFECPQSMISRVLFDTVLGIGDIGFNEKPGCTNPVATTA